MTTPDTTPDTITVDQRIEQITTYIQRGNWRAAKNTVSLLAYEATGGRLRDLDAIASHNDPALTGWGPYGGPLSADGAYIDRLGKDDPMKSGKLDGMSRDDAMAAIRKARYQFITETLATFHVDDLTPYEQGIAEHLATLDDGAVMVIVSWAARAYVRGLDTAEDMAMDMLGSRDARAAAGQVLP